MTGPRMAVLQLAEELFDRLNGVDRNTAYTALDIAKQLIIHRQMTILDYEQPFKAMASEGEPG